MSRQSSFSSFIFFPDQCSREHHYVAALRLIRRKKKTRERRRERSITLTCATRNAHAYAFIVFSWRSRSFHSCRVRPPKKKVNECVRNFLYFSYTCTGPDRHSVAAKQSPIGESGRTSTKRKVEVPSFFSFVGRPQSGGQKSSPSDTPHNIREERRMAEREAFIFLGPDHTKIKGIRNLLVWAFQENGPTFSVNELLIRKLSRNNLPVNPHLLFFSSSICHFVGHSIILCKR